ncbi:hypothetical protein [Longirhabdus pacifica]|uniref:hypothetical protein n=1 Tax=Longirhabdus pacifica TaxID=2305227 RepID=UPI001008B83F|nr:hypothetical protein [Longirhabdus pacifica]
MKKITFILAILSFMLFPLSSFAEVSNRQFNVMEENNMLPLTCNIENYRTPLGDYDYVVPKSHYDYCKSSVNPIPGPQTGWEQFQSLTTIDATKLFKTELMHYNSLPEINHTHIISLLKGQFYKYNKTITKSSSIKFHSGFSLAAKFKKIISLSFGAEFNYDGSWSETKEWDLGLYGPDEHHLRRDYYTAIAFDRFKAYYGSDYYSLHIDWNGNGGWPNPPKIQTMYVYDMKTELIDVPHQITTYHETVIP